LSSALTLVNILKDEKEFLVWDCIAENIASLVSVWWEHPRLTTSLNAFRRALYNPLIQRLGYEYLETDSADATLLRTRAIHQAAMAEDQDVLRELKGRFDHYMNTGDNSKIPADLMRITLVSAVKYGGRQEYDFVKKIYEKPPNPSTSISAIIAMGQSLDRKLIDETLEYMTTKSRDQDVVYFFIGLSSNRDRRILMQFFMKNYDALQKRFEESYGLRYLVEHAFTSLSAEKDYGDVVEFFKDKDTSKYSMALAQVLETIRAQITWIDRSTSDMGQWLDKRGKVQ